MIALRLLIGIDHAALYMRKCDRNVIEIDMLDLLCCRVDTHISRQNIIAALNCATGPKWSTEM